MKVMKRKIITLFLIILSIIFAFPVIILVISSFMGKEEILQSFSSILSNSDEYVKIAIIPKYPTLRSYVSVLLDTPEFFVTYFNSVKIVFFVLLGQLLVGVPAAWGFAKYNFRFKKLIFTLYIILMLMPFQVTMLSSYLLLDKVNLINNHLSIILPGIFSTFSIFIMYRSFKTIPDEVIEVGKMDGANDFQIFIKIGIPLGLPGIISALLLQFFEYWNLIEQPLTYLSDKNLWPLSLYLPNINLKYADISFVASVIVLITAVLVFLAGEKYLEEGISTLGEKG